MLPAALLLIVLSAQAATAPKAATAKKVVAAKKITPAVKGVKTYNDKESLAVKKKASDFVSKNLITDGTKIETTVVDKYNGLYLLKIKLGEGDSLREVDAAMTANGQYFFPQIMKVAEIEKQKKDEANKPAGNSAPSPSANLPKADKPTVELFVMSYCPYGTQIEKGLLPVAEALGSAIDFKIKFVDYAMHGNKEVEENLRQYCIQDQEPAKYPAYLKCFLEAADATDCVARTKIDTAKLTACTSATDQKFSLTADAANKDKLVNGSFPPFNINKTDNEKYGVQGSPTLIINGQEANSGRDSASLAKTICGAFTAGQAPAACQNTFSAATPAPGFGAGTTTNTATGGCH